MNETEKKMVQCQRHNAVIGQKRARQATGIQEESIHDNGDNSTVFELLPPGFRFRPSDDELLNGYLKMKIMNQPLPMNRIHEVELYKHNPDDLTEKYSSYGEKRWYFFTPRDRKYKNGSRPNRAAGNGYWKASGKAIEIKIDGEIIGHRTTLVFYIGKAPKGDKSDWSMHEYLMGNSLASCRTNKEPNDMKLDDWVLCELYKKLERTRQVHDTKAQVEGVIAADSKKRRIQDRRFSQKQSFVGQFSYATLPHQYLQRDYFDSLTSGYNYDPSTIATIGEYSKPTSTPNNPNSPDQVNVSKDIGQVNNFTGWINSSSESSIFSYDYSQNSSIIHEYTDPISVKAVSINSYNPGTIYDYRNPTSVEPASINSSTQHYTKTLYQPTGYASNDPWDFNSTIYGNPQPPL